MSAARVDEMVARNALLGITPAKLLADFGSKLAADEYIYLEKLVKGESTPGNEPAPAAKNARYSQYCDYLSAIFRPGDMLCFVGIDHRKAKGDKDTTQFFVPYEHAVTREYFDTLDRANADGSIYVAMNTFKPELGGQNKGRTQDNVVAVRAVQADIDNNGDETMSAIKSSVAVPAPSIVVQSSPGKFQGIWLVDGVSKEEAKPLMQAIASTFNTDSAVAEVARVMRLPGFVNRKYDSAPVATTLVQTNARYRREDFRVESTPKFEQNISPEEYLNAPFIRQGGPYGGIYPHVLKIVGHYVGKIKDGDVMFDIVNGIKMRNGCFLSDGVTPYEWNEKQVRQQCLKLVGEWKDEGGPLDLNQKPATQTSAPQLEDWRNNFKSISELENGEPRMLIRNFLPEGTIFIGALAGEGKTLLGLSIAKALTTGNNFLNQFDFSVPQITPILYLIPESGGRAFRKRCETFQIPDDPKLFLARTISEGGTLLLDNPFVLEAVRVMKPVVILDTLIRFSEADDENQASQNKQMVDDIIRLRQAGATAVIGMHHATKAMREKGMSLETALRGTGDIAAAADAVYGMLRDSTLYSDGAGPNEIDVACLKPRDFEPPKPFRIAASEKTEDLITGASLIVSVIDQLHDFRVVSERTKGANLDQRIKEMIAQDPNVSRKVLMEETGVSEWEVRQALKRLGLSRGRGGSAGAPAWQSRQGAFQP